LLFPIHIFKERPLILMQSRWIVNKFLILKGCKGTLDIHLCKLITSFFSPFR